MSAAGIQAVLFDLDNTLIDREAALRPTLRALLAEHLPGAELEAALEELIAADERGYRPRRDYARWLVERLGLPLDPEALSDAFMAQLPEHVPRRPQPLALLGWLEAAGLRLGIVSNGGPGQRRKMARAGLAAGRFEAVVISGEVGCAKPAPEIFARALDQLNLPPGRALYVGDDPHRDVAGARAAGLPCAWVSLGRGWDPAWGPQPARTAEQAWELDYSEIWQ